ncbi:hypothetical protein B5S28_g1678 [[Candida] boidinii]|uniref:Unnamed protein product n=1 Tax=Candida boidinii TaxID=5477 RepID=A0ACB5TEE9_CANBO|nr:hypothetical protein B5S28_g1678 [[Candida] boidinii]OWB61994.1 hypothetical protein B5S29_g2904 [[Candida] boidinii]OWB72971.1 hypothetical protein B5S31_g2700 [[Candida] boidinii]OWB78768.1 hypothetical protein B5S32_g2970 [[Candida] boidinii]GME69248.1 unnamed protein product [[Candida] boidinii]
MGAAYNIFGKSVQPHWLAIGTIASVVGGIVGPKLFAAPADAAAPAATAAPVESKPADGEFDVEKSIKYVINL